MFHKTTVKQKVYFLAFLGMLISLMLSAGAVFSINAVGVQLKQIAEEDIPLTNAVANITTHQLEQAVLFERATRYAVIMDFLALNNSGNSGDVMPLVTKQSDALKNDIDALKTQLSSISGTNVAVGDVIDLPGKPDLANALTLLQAIESKNNGFKTLSGQGAAHGGGDHPSAAELEALRVAAQKHYGEVKAEFITLSHKVSAEILDAEAKVAHVIEIEAGNSKIVDEFTHVLDVLYEIEKAHKGFEDHALEVFTLFEQGKMVEAEHSAEKVEKEEGALNHELEALLIELEEFTAEAAKHAEHLEEQLLQILAIVCTVSLVIFGTLSFFIVQGIVRPLLATKNYAEELSRENLDVEQPVHNFKDEIADMMSALSVFKENAIEAKKVKDAQAEQEIRAEADKKAMMMDLAQSFDDQVGGLIGSLGSASTELQSTAQSMRNIADETSQASQTVAASSEEASVNVNTVASAMEEMSASSTEIASQINMTRTKSNDTAENAQNANMTVSNLSELVENIGEVVEAIQDIAEQTNLLALNATIEAARAGDAGKGFAVVADEVKKLATETGQKTEEINTRITEIQGATHASVEAMQRIISNISEIDESVTGVSAAVEEQNATTSEIVRSISEASQGSQQVSEIIIEVQKSAGETGNSADSVLGAAQEVATLSDNLKNSVDGFLEQIRSDNDNVSVDEDDQDLEAAE